MSLPIQYRATALKDVGRRLKYFARIDVDLSRRFIQKVEETIIDISQSQGRGSPWHSRTGRSTMRSRPVIGFASVSASYRESNGVLTISRVLHTKQNISRILRTGNSI
jgi:plasmid stabilization system protein ParE